MTFVKIAGEFVRGIEKIKRPRDFLSASNRVVRFTQCAA